MADKKPNIVYLRPKLISREEINKKIDRILAEEDCRNFWQKIKDLFKRRKNERDNHSNS